MCKVSATADFFFVVVFHLITFSSNFNPQAVALKGFLSVPCEVKQTSISTQFVAGLGLSSRSSSALSGSFARGFTSTSPVPPKVPAAPSAGGAEAPLITVE